MKKKYTVVIYWLIIIVLLFLFFTNDFGLVDIRKTSIITAVGVDVEGEEVVVTAQVAIPQPSQSGENVQYSEVQGSGETVYDALNEINSKTGFYPKLLFCKIIILGESCQNEQLFRVLGCFYRKNFSELTAQVAMCEGKASELLARPAALGSDMNTEAIQRAMSDELKKSANCSVVNLKDIALTAFSQSRACYMPYIQAIAQGTSENGGNGDNAGGEKPQQGGGSGGSGGQSGGGSESGQSGGSGQDVNSKVEFVARKTAVFSDGKFKTILDERQSFALNLLKNEIRLAVVPCDADGTHYSVGLKNAGGGVSLKMDGGSAKVSLSFDAKAQINGAKKEVVPNENLHDDLLGSDVLDGAEKEIASRMEQLVAVIKEYDCDVLGIRELLHKYHYGKFEELKDSIISDMQVEYKVEIKSVN